MTTFANCRVFVFSAQINYINYDRWEHSNILTEQKFELLFVCDSCNSLLVTSNKLDSNQFFDHWIKPTVFVYIIWMALQYIHYNNSLIFECLLDLNVSLQVCVSYMLTNSIVSCYSNLRMQRFCWRRELFISKMMMFGNSVRHFTSSAVRHRFSIEVLKQHLFLSNKPYGAREVESSKSN